MGPASAIAAALLAAGVTTVGGRTLMPRKARAPGGARRRDAARKLKVKLKLGESAG